MSRDYDADYSTYGTWKEYHDKLNSEGMTDPQIVTNLKGTKWDTPDSNYAKWAKPIKDTLEARTPEAEQLLRKQLREQYKDDFDGYKNTLAQKGLTIDQEDEQRLRKQLREQYKDDFDGYENALTQKGLTRNTEDEQLLKEQLRKQYANDNEGYLKALKDNNIAVSNPSGKVRSIQEAYYDGGIDKSTRDYMMADAIAKFARNTGRDIGNIGAQFTGGTINNNYETPIWNDRNTELFKQKTSSEAAGIKGSDKNAQRRQQNANAYGTELSNEKNNKVLDFSRNVKKMADDARKKKNDKLATVLDYIASSAAGGNLSYTDLITALGADALNGGEPENPEGENPEDPKKAKAELINEWKSKYQGLSGEEYTNTYQELDSQLKGVKDPNKQQALREAAEEKIKERYKAKLINEWKSKYQGLSDEEYANTYQELDSQLKGVEDAGKRKELRKEMGKKLKEKSEAAELYNEAVNYFTTDQRFLNFHDGMEGFDPKNPTPEQIAILKRIALSKTALNWKERNYAKAYLTKMGLQ